VQTGGGRTIESDAGVPVSSPEPQHPPPNNSGSGGPAPPQLRRWSWGAFFLHWIWGVANNVWIAFLVLLLPVVWNIVLGVKGNEWAWQHRRFESLEKFDEIQAVWARWGLILFILGVVVPAIALAAIALFTLRTVGIELPE